MALVLIGSVITPQSVSALTVSGSPDNPSLTINKYEQEQGSENGEGNGSEINDVEGDPLPGVTFEINQTHTFDSETNTWTEITDGTGADYTRVTDENGQVVLNNLPLGRYTFQEIDGPEDVVLNTEVFSVDVPLTQNDGNTLNYDVNVYPKNEIIRGAVELTKTGEDGQALSGAVFELFKASETGEDVSSGTYTTSAAGLIQIDGLAYGDYYFVETEAPEGHAIDNTPVEFSIVEPGTISADGETTGVVVDTERVNYEMPEIDKKIVDPETGDLIDNLNINRDKAYSYQIDSNLPGDIGEYAEYEISDSLDDRLSLVGGSVEVLIDGNPAGDAVSVTEGETIITTVNDFSALAGAETLTVTFDATINSDAELNPEETGIPNTATLDFDNDRGENPEDPPTTPPVIVTPADGGVTVIKVDEDDNSILLEGAVFDLNDAEGNPIAVPENSVVRVNGEVVTSLQGLTTDEQGRFEVTGLNLGDYQLEEVEAPTYVNENGETNSYRLLTSPIDITITEASADDYNVTVENSKSGWELPQTGGMGTTWFTIIGFLMMVAAGVYMMRKRKVDSEL